MDVLFDSGLTFHGYISKVVSSGFCHLRSIASVNKYLRQDSLATLVQSFVGSPIDFCNSIFYGLPAYEIQRLQRLQNQAARLVTNSRKYDHITPVLKNRLYLYNKMWLAKTVAVVGCVVSDKPQILAFLLQLHAREFSFNKNDLGLSL